MPRPLQIVADRAQRADRVPLHRRVDLMPAEAGLLEELRQRLDGIAAGGHAEQHAAEVLERRLARLPAQAVTAEHALHPRVGGDHRPAGVRLGFEIVDRLVDRVRDVGGQRPVVERVRKPGGAGGAGAAPSTSRTPSASQTTPADDGDRPLEGRRRDVVGAVPAWVSCCAARRALRLRWKPPEWWWRRYTISVIGEQHDRDARKLLHDALAEAAPLAAG